MSRQANVVDILLAFDPILLHLDRAERPTQPLAGAGLLLLMMRELEDSLDHLGDDLSRSLKARSDGQGGEEAGSRQWTDGKGPV